MDFFAHFAIPFTLGATWMTLVIAWKYVYWIVSMPKSDLRKVGRSIFSTRTLGAVWETIRESLLHVSIFRVSPRLGYMHASLAFGWFLLIAFGWAEVTAYMGFGFIPPSGHVFFKYFAAGNISEHIAFFDFVMDLLLLVVLSGVAMAWLKRIRSRWLGLGHATRHVLTDRLAVSFLWWIFPLRLIAESVTAGLYGGGGFLTRGLGDVMASAFGQNALAISFEPVWWLYSIALGGFFAFMPFSRYMHIFTEVPLIFLRAYGVRPQEKTKSSDSFEIQACSRCGICIDPCQLQDVLGINDVQSVYFLRDRRYARLRLSTASNCLMCGRCEARCPVGINLNTLRLNSRSMMRNIPNERRYSYFNGLDRSSGDGRVGYFAGCMTLTTPRTLEAMRKIFDSAGENVWWADKDGGVCCGRPLKLSGEVNSARKMMDFNKELFRRHGITTLVTSCPICLKTFREDYDLEGVEVLHHSQYIERLLRDGRIGVDCGDRTFVYHDPCELGRGSGIYASPRTVISQVGSLVEPIHSGKDSLCCGGSLANTVINDSQQMAIARRVTEEMSQTGADCIVTSCPLCKKTLARTATQPVSDLSEIVASSLRG